MSELNVNSIVRVVGNRDIGTGFVVSDDGLIVTCAHVLGPARPEKVDVVFQGSGEQREALVESWHAEDAEDIALLRVCGRMPAGALPLPLGSSLETEGHPFTTFGYHQIRKVEGVRGTGTIVGQGMKTETKQPLLQLHSSEITGRFGGAPVWDELRSRVVGIVAIVIPMDPYGKLSETAFAIPTETLQAISPALQVRDICPYRNLAAFTEENAEFFFGRKQVIEQLLNNLQNEPRFLVVFGASGSGKSSVVQAGLIPRLREGALPGSDGWKIVVTRPTDFSFRQRLASLDQTSAPVVFVIDQFEELFVTSSEVTSLEVITQVTQLLEHAPKVTLLIVMRADFSSLFMHRKTLEKWLPRCQVNVWSPSEPEEIEAIIREPARQVGWQFQEGLIELIVNDVRAATKAENTKDGNITILPLLEFTLTQLWERRQDGILTREAYGRIGGVTGGLRKWAEDAYCTFEERLQPLVRRIFTDLVYLSDQKQPIANSRKRRPLSTLIHSDAESADTSLVVEQLRTARLLVASQDQESKQETIEITHDALLWEWGRLRQWLEEDRRFLMWRQEFEKRTQAWVETNKDDPSKRDSYKLIGGPDLTEALDWVKMRAQDLSHSEHEFIQASKERRKQYRRRTVVLAGLGVVGLAVGLTGAGIGLLRKPTAGRTALLPLSVPYTLHGHTDAVLSVIWSPDGKQLASAGADTTVQVWGATTGSPLLTFRGHTDVVESVAWSPDGKWLASAGDDKTVRVWDARHSLLLLIYRGHIQRVASIGWSPDGRHLASASADTTVQVWDAASGSLLLNYGGHTAAVTSVAWSPDGKRLVSAGDDKTVQVSDASIATSIIQLTYRGHTDMVLSVSWSPDGERLASASDDGTVQVWNAATGQTLLTYTGLMGTGVLCVAWSPDGKRLASGGNGYGATVEILDAATGQTLLTYKGHTQMVTSVAWSPDSKRLASASGDGTVQIWNAASGSHLLTLAVYANSVAWSPDGKRLASASGDGIRVWDATTSSLVLTYRGHTDAVESVAWSPDGKWLASASDDTTVQVCDAASGSHLLTYRGHTDWVLSVAWSPDGKWVASAGSDYDATVQVWNASIATDMIQLTYRGHTGAVNSVAWSPDGKRVASAGNDSTVQLWLW